jgi:hypothetical protein
MLSTKHLIQNCKDVPETWIFENYCKLSEKLNGQDIKIKSVFNPNDNTPSMCFFIYNGKYFFKDFSTGIGGTAVKLVQELFKEDFKQSSGRIVEDYNKFVLTNNGATSNLSEFKVHSKYKVTSHVVRPFWSVQDQMFWEKFGISSKQLKEYNVKPLESYKMEKTEDGEIKSFEIKSTFIYGYYTKSDVLYKIYQPMVKEHKFIKIANHLQGIEQCKNHDFLIISSSLKDAMVIKSAGLKIDVIASDSENVMIKKETIDLFKQKYKKVLTLFDNDEPGIKAMKKYKEEYDIDYIYFDLEKDVADAVKIHGVSKTFCKLIPAITKKIN